MGLGDFVQKAVFLGVGLASYASEKANETLGELRVQAQKLAEEMVARGEMTSEEARKFVDDMLAKAQTPSAEPTTETPRSEPRRIEIVTDDEPASENNADVEAMQRRVAELQEELRRLQRNE